MGYPPGSYLAGVSVIHFGTTRYAVFAVVGLRAAAFLRNPNVGFPNLGVPFQGSL